MKKKRDKSKENSREVTWFLQNSIPYMNAGAETVAHVFNLYLVKHGYIVNVVGPWKESNYEGVNYINSSNKKVVKEAVERSKILCSQLFHAEYTVNLGRQEYKNVIIFVHSVDYNKYFINKYKYIIDPSKLLLVYNSDSMKSQFDEYVNTFVLYPPVDCSIYKTKTNQQYVTMINLSEKKGGNQLIKIAKKMPHIKFLGVHGGYDMQIMDETVNNITYVENTKDMRSIYAKTDILLIPSNPETWGRTATEAMCSGIPVIAHPTEGLKENLGEAGIFIDKEDVDKYIDEIYKLKEDRNYYGKVSEKCKQRSKELYGEKQLIELVDKIEEL